MAKKEIIPTTKSGIMAELAAAGEAPDPDAEE